MSRKPSARVAERHAADKELAAEYSTRLAAAEAAERALRRAQAGQRAYPEVLDLAFEFDRALLAVLVTAEAALRAEMGPPTYVDPGTDAPTRRRAEIAARKARARADVKPWVAEVERLRTLRERHRLTFRAQSVV
jgi:hypothetical protein